MRHHMRGLTLTRPLLWLAVYLAACADARAMTDSRQMGRVIAGAAPSPLPVLSMHVSLALMQASQHAANLIAVYLLWLCLSRPPSGAGQPLGPLVGGSLPPSTCTATMA
jgi:hypothetical protein